MDDNQDAATKRKPTRPAKVSTGAKSKKRKTEPEIIGSIQASSLAKEKTNYINMFEFKPEGYREFNLDNSTEKTKIIEAMDKETIVPLSEGQSIAVNDLLRELDCFELKRKHQTQTKATQSSVCPMVTNNQATQTEPETTELVNMFCPIHNVCEQEFVSKNGWSNGVKCPWGEYLLFTFMEVVHRQLHQELSKQNWKQLACFCDRPMRLRMSHSANNHKHSHVDCNKKDSNFFQCADSPLNPNNVTWVDPIPDGALLQDERSSPLNPIKECSGNQLFAEPN